MKIEFLTQDDPIYILPFFEEFFRNQLSAFEVVQVSCCRAMGSRPRRRLVRELAGLYGPAGLLRLAGRMLGAHSLGRLPLARSARRFYSMPQLCRAYGVPCERIGNPNRPEYAAVVAQRRPDLIVSVACPYILKPRLLNLPPLGCINIHHAPLPRYKGMMPTFWQLYHGEKTVGLTIHYMAEKVDEGRALLQDSLAVRAGESLDALIRRSKRHAANCLAWVLRDLESRSQPAPAADYSGGSYFTFPTPAEIREFRRRGLRAI